MSLSTPFIHRPVATTLLTIALRWPVRWRTGCCRSRRCRRWTFRTHLGQRQPAGGEPGDHGVGGGDAARAAVRPHRRRHRDDLVQLPGLDVRSRCSST